MLGCCNFIDCPCSDYLDETGASKISVGMHNRWCMILNIVIALSCFLQSARGDQFNFSNMLETLAYGEWSL